STNGAVGSLRSVRIFEKILSFSVLADNSPLTFSMTNTAGLCLAIIRRYSLYNPTLLSLSSSRIVSRRRDLPTNEYAWHGGPPISTQSFFPANALLIRRSISSLVVAYLSPSSALPSVAHHASSSAFLN